LEWRLRKGQRRAIPKDLPPKNMSYLVNARPIDLVVPQSDQLLSTL